MLSNLFQKLFKKTEKTILLGRWNRSNNSIINSQLANYDHCGDVICKDPKQISKLIQSEILRDSKK